MKFNKNLDSLFRQIVENANDAVVIADSKSQIVFWNLAASRIFGYAESDVLGLDMHDLITPPEYRERAKKAFKIYVETGNGGLVGVTKVVPAIDVNNNSLFVELTISRLLVEGRNWAFAFLRDATERVGREKKLENQALKDPLTQLSNRRCFQRFIESIDIAMHTLCLIDLDKFKSLNDIYGHDIGDSVLSFFSKQLSLTISASCHIARMGGEEFSIIAPKHNFQLLIEQLRQLNEYCQNSELTDLPNFSFSSGICLPKPKMTLRAAMTEADLQLYNAKRHGRKSIFYQSKPL